MGTLHERGNADRWSPNSRTWKVEPLTYNEQEAYKSYHIDGMKLERNVYEVITKRLNKWIEKGVVKVIGNNTYDVSKYISQGGGVDHRIIVGDRIFHIEDKNLRQYNRGLSCQWAEREIFNRYSPKSQKYLITTYENGTLSGTLKEKLELTGIKTIYVGRKLVSWCDKPVRALLHKALTPLFKKIENHARLLEKKNELKSRRMKGTKPDNIDSDSNNVSNSNIVDVRSKGSLYDYTNNTIQYTTNNTIYVEIIGGRFVWRVGFDPPERDSMPVLYPGWEGLL